MKVHKLLLLFVLLLCSIPLGATSYYLSPTGSDSNSGMTPAAAWLSPNHAVNCGDTIIAAASNSYSYANFGFGKWGTVNCAAGNNVAWLTCATFDACKINFSASLQPGMEVSASYWGVQGWEIDGTKATGPCFEAWPWTTWNHIIFANNIANGCGLSGFSTSNSGSANSIDYIAIVGNIAYNSAGGTYYCGSGISVYEPIASDSLPGTHIYIAGNFSYANFDGACSGSGATDGEGINLDTFDGSQGGTPLYTQQTVVDNNILIGNGGPGLELFNNYQGSGSPGPVYFRHNTMWGNNANPIELVPAYAVGELLLYQGYNATVTQNIAMTNATNGAHSQPIYAYWVSQGSGTDVVSQNWGYAASGNTSNIYSSQGFSYGSTNVFGTDPNFVNPAVPGAPSCGGFANVPACMATVIANFTPRASEDAAYGYQPVSSSPASDPLFPQWLCNANLPEGLVTLGCSSTPVPPTALKAIAH